MNKPRIPALAALTVILAIVCLVWFQSAKGRARTCEWPSVQMHRAIELCLALANYHNQHGTYPESLESLVSSSNISADTLRELMFQDTPLGDRQYWIYHNPIFNSDIAIVSLRPVIPWAGSTGDYITARPDGSGEMIGAAKVLIIESLIKRQLILLPLSLIH